MCILVLAGGGGSDGDGYYRGGGGAGGLELLRDLLIRGGSSLESALTLNLAQNYTITVGAGGAEASEHTILIKEMEVILLLPQLHQPEEAVLVQFYNWYRSKWN